MQYFLFNTFRFPFIPDKTTDGGIMTSSSRVTTDVDSVTTSSNIITTPPDTITKPAAIPEVETGTGWETVIIAVTGVTGVIVLIIVLVVVFVGRKGFFFFHSEQKCALARCSFLTGYFSSSRGARK